MLSNAIIDKVQQGPLSESELTPRASNTLNAMLSGDLWKSTGYSVLADGTPYVASLTDFPDSTKDMFEW